MARDMRLIMEKGGLHPPGQRAVGVPKHEETVASSATAWLHFCSDRWEIRQAEAHPNADPSLL